MNKRMEGLGSHPSGPVIVLDDQFASRKVLATLVADVAGGREVHEFENPVSALVFLRRSVPDLVLADYKMPGMNGIEFTRRFRQLVGSTEIPLIMVTSSTDLTVRREALMAGATDFLTKPVDHVETRARASNLLRLREHQHTLEQRVAEATHEVRLREHETLMRLARAGEYRDMETGLHILRMARYSRLIAEGLGLHSDYCQLIEAAAPMHDVGKIGIPDHILRKPGRHTPEEMVIMRRHTLIGHHILKDSPSSYLQLGAEIALNHHEWVDGSGYPYGLRGDTIPLEARIVAVADVFDALATDRPYKSAWSTHDALEYLTRQSGSHFDPACVAAFKARIVDVLETHDLLRDEGCTGGNPTMGLTGPLHLNVNAE